MTARRTWIKRVMWGLVTIAVIYTVLNLTERFWLKDFGGMTRAHIEELSIEEQYGLLSDRLDVMHELLEQSQHQLHHGEWRVGDYGRITAGHYSPHPLRGTNSRNSYFLQTARVWDSHISDGTHAQLRPLENLFRKRAWSYGYEEVHFPGETLQVISADAGEGWMIMCRLYPDGTFILEVMSGPFWADTFAVKRARHNRAADLGPEYALPGEIPEFPAWDGPLKPPSQRSEPPVPNSKGR